MQHDMNDCCTGLLSFLLVDFKTKIKHAAHPHSTVKTTMLSGQPFWCQAKDVASCDHKKPLNILLLAKGQNNPTVSDDANGC